MLDWLIAIGAYLILVGGLTIVAILRRPPGQIDPRAYEIYDPEVSDWMIGVRRRDS